MLIELCRRKFTSSITVCVQVQQHSRVSLRWDADGDEAIDQFEITDELISTFGVDGDAAPDAHRTEYGAAGLASRLNGLGLGALAKRRK